MYFYCFRRQGLSEFIPLFDTVVIIILIKQSMNTQYATRPFNHKAPFTQYRSVNIKVCHAQLNQMGQSAVRWNLRNNRINTSHLSQRRPLPRKGPSETFRRLVTQRPCEAHTSSIKELNQDGERIDESKQLMRGLTKLKHMNLLLARQLRCATYSCKPNKLVDNDYHERTSRHGFSRSCSGKFYTS